jgi:hypothetical protein
MRLPWAMSSCLLGWAERLLTYSLAGERKSSRRTGDDLQRAGLEHDDHGLALAEAQALRPSAR